MTAHPACASGLLTGRGQQAERFTRIQYSVAAVIQSLQSFFTTAFRDRNQTMAADANSFNINDISRRMEGALAALKDEFSGLRTGRASSGLLEPIQVDAYGSMTPLVQVASVSVSDSRMLVVQVWDRGLASAVDKAIRTAGIGLNPVMEGQTLRVPIPPLNEERRREFAKLAAKYAEHARVAIRNVRRDGMDILKKLEKSGDLSQDQQKILSEKVQTQTDAFIKKVDDSLKSKEDEIMQV